MRFLNDMKAPFELTYDDVFMVPSLSTIPSRFDVDLASDDGTGTTIPLVVSNMTAVAGTRMAETMARRGGLVVLPQDVPADIVAKTIRKVKKASTVYETPVTLGPHDTVMQALALINKRSHKVVIVIDDQRRPLGLVPESALKGVDRFTQLHTIMRSELVKVTQQHTPEEVHNALTQAHVSVALVLDDDQRLCGVWTRKGALRSTIYQPNVDADNKLAVAAAIGINGDVAARARDIMDAGANVLVVDTAHGFQEKTLEALHIVRDMDLGVPIVAGNVVTAEATRALLKAGADIVKVGIGPGAMCTTRMATGVGRPQLSAVLECAAEAHRHGGHVWADGGVRHPRDVALALAAGASNVMVGSWFAGTYESPGDIQIDSKGRPYKENFGMASRRAVRHRNASQTGFERARRELFEEGISSSRMYLQPGSSSVEDLIDQILAGVRSSFTYAGARNQHEFRERAIVGIQSTAGFKEGVPVPTSWN